MAGTIKSALAAAMLMASAGSILADEPPYHRDIRDLNATILDLKGLPSGLNSAVSDLSSQVTELAARHRGLSVRQDKTAVRVSMTDDVLFDFDKANIKPTAEPTLKDIGQLIASVPTGTILIEGHTDAKGAAAYNKRLSLRRANAVAAWLAAHGTAKTRLSVKGLGSSRPVAPNTLANGADNPEGRALNRRVEFVLPNPRSQQSSQ